MAYAIHLDPNESVHHPSIVISEFDDFKVVVSFKQSVDEQVWIFGGDWQEKHIGDYLSIYVDPPTSTSLEAFRSPLGALDHPALNAIYPEYSPQQRHTYVLERTNGVMTLSIDGILIQQSTNYTRYFLSKLGFKGDFSTKAGGNWYDYTVDKNGSRIIDLALDEPFEGNNLGQKGKIHELDFARMSNTTNVDVLTTPVLDIPSTGIWRLEIEGKALGHPSGKTFNSLFELYAYWNYNSKALKVSYDGTFSSSPSGIFNTEIQDLLSTGHGYFKIEYEVDADNALERIRVFDLFPVSGNKPLFESDWQATPALQSDQVYPYQNAYFRSAGLNDFQDASFISARITNLTTNTIINDWRAGDFNGTHIPDRAGIKDINVLYPYDGSPVILDEAALRIPPQLPNQPNTPRIATNANQLTFGGGTPSTGFNEDYDYTIVFYYKKTNETQNIVGTAQPTGWEYNHRIAIEADGKIRVGWGRYGGASTFNALDEYGFTTTDSGKMTLRRQMVNDVETIYCNGHVAFTKTFTKAVEHALGQFGAVYNSDPTYSGKIYEFYGTANQGTFALDIANSSGTSVVFTGTAGLTPWEAHYFGDVFDNLHQEITPTSTLIESSDSETETIKGDYKVLDLKGNAVSEPNNPTATGKVPTYLSLPDMYHEQGTEGIFDEFSITIEVDLPDLNTTNNTELERYTLIDSAFLGVYRSWNGGWFAKINGRAYNRGVAVYFWDDHNGGLEPLTGRVCLKFEAKKNETTGIAEIIAYKGTSPDLLTELGREADNIPNDSLSDYHASFSGTNYNKTLPINFDIDFGGSQFHTTETENRYFAKATYHRIIIETPQGYKEEFSSSGLDTTNTWVSKSGYKVGRVFNPPLDGSHIKPVEYFFTHRGTYQSQTTTSDFLSTISYSADNLDNFQLTTESSQSSKVELTLRIVDIESSATRYGLIGEPTNGIWQLAIPDGGVVNGVLNSINWVGGGSATGLNIDMSQWTTFTLIWAGDEVGQYPEYAAYETVLLINGVEVGTRGSHNTKTSFETVGNHYGRVIQSSIKSVTAYRSGELILDLDLGNPDSGFKLFDRSGYGNHFSITKAGGVGYPDSEYQNWLDYPIVSVEDTEVPIIQNPYVGLSVNHKIGDAFIIHDALVTDNVDDDVYVTPVSTVDINTIGSYTLTYNHTDSSGNVAEPLVVTVNIVNSLLYALNYNGEDRGVTLDSTIVTATDQYIVLECRGFSYPGSSTTWTYFIDGASGSLRSYVAVQGAILKRNNSTIKQIIINDHENTDLVVTEGSSLSFLQDGRDFTIKIVFHPGEVGTFGSRYSIRDGESIGSFYGIINRITYHDSDDTVLHDWYNTTGTGNTLADNVGGNNGTLLNPAVDDSHWLLTGATNTPETPVDTTAPEITNPYSGTTVNLEVGDAFTVLDATVTDDTDATTTISPTGSVDVNTAGTYTLTYNHSDAAGNAATPLVITVEVTEPLDTTKPVISGVNAVYEVEVNSAWSIPNATWTDNVDGSGTVVGVGSVDLTTVGNYQITYDYTDAAGNAADTVLVNVNVVDTTKPVIATPGTSVYTVNVGDSFTPPDLMVTDNYDSNNTAFITGSVNTNVVGSYTLYYNWTDSNGNSADEVTITVNVVDAVSPVISAPSNPTPTVQVGDTYTPPSLVVSDNYDSDTTVTPTGSVDTNTVGTYTLYYNHTDANGNHADQVTITVTVEDNVKPVISGVPTTVTLNVGDTYVPPQATVTDNYDASTTISPTFNNVDTATVGSYEVRYNFTDTNGNDADQVITSVTVQDIVKPVLSAVQTSYTIQHGASFTVPTVTASDNYDSSTTVTTTDTIDVYTLGTQLLRYNHTDSNGNSADELVISVEVVDTQIPVITVPYTSTSVLQNSVYNPPLASVTDNVDGTQNISPVVNTVDTAILGTYILSYDFTDSSGNVAVTKNISVEVVNQTTPVISVPQTTYTVEYGNAFTIPNGSTTDSSLGSVVVTTSDTIDTSVLGSQTLNYTYTDTNGLSATPVVITVNVVDTTAPTISVPQLSYTVEQYSAFSIPQGTANDNYDSNVTVVPTGSVDTDTLGTYTLTYNHTDSQGNVAQTVTVTVTVENTVVPVIVLPQSVYTIEVGSSFTLPIASVTDSQNGVTAVTTLDTIDTDVIGISYLRYNYTDSNGLTAQEQAIQVRVQDTQKPVITVPTQTSITHEYASVFNYPVLTVTDNYDTNSVATRTGTVDVNQLGVYTLTYNHTDASGNVADPVVITVTVVNTTKPTITVTQNTYNIELYSSFSLPNATVIDTVLGSLSVTPVGSVNINALGSYTLTYDYVDSNGLTADTVYVTVNVQNTVAPVWAVDSTSIDTLYGSSFTVPQRTVVDNIFGNVLVSTTDTIDTNVLGTQTLTYNYVDSSGLSAPTLTVSVNVLDTVKPVINAPYTRTTITKGSAFSYPVVSSQDNVDGTTILSPSGYVDANVVGTYTLVYNYTDSSGNEADTVYVDVEVVNNTEIRYDGVFNIPVELQNKPNVWYTVHDLSGNPLSHGQLDTNKLTHTLSLLDDSRENEIVVMFATDLDQSLNSNSYVSCVTAQIIATVYET